MSVSSAATLYRYERPALSAHHKDSDGHASERACSSVGEGVMVEDDHAAKADGAFKGRTGDNGRQWANE